MTRTIENAVIEGTMLGREDHGIMTCYLHCSMNGSGQGFGGYSFDSWNEKKKRRIGHAFGMEMIAAILRTVGVETWETLPGRHVRIDHDYSKVYRLGHIIEDRWFDPQELFKEEAKP